MNGVRIVILILAAMTAAATPALQLDPLDGALTGGPGDVVGWGFTLLNDKDYLVVTSASYVTLTNIGVFSDFISGQFMVIGPAPEQNHWTQTFAASLSQGIGSYEISKAAPAGALSTGSLQLTYDLYSLSPNDPNFDPSKHTLSTGTVLSATVSVAVPASIPEPGTFGLLGLGALLLRKRRRLGAS